MATAHWGRRRLLGCAPPPGAGGPWWLGRNPPWPRTPGAPGRGRVVAGTRAPCRPTLSEGAAATRPRHARPGHREQLPARGRPRRPGLWARGLNGPGRPAARAQNSRRADGRSTWSILMEPTYWTRRWRGCPPTRCDSTMTATRAAGFGRFGRRTLRRHGADLETATAAASSARSAAVGSAAALMVGLWSACFGIRRCHLTNIFYLTS